MASEFEEVQSYNKLVVEVNVTIDKIVDQLKIMTPGGHEWFVSAYENISDKFAWKITLRDGWVGDDIDDHGFRDVYELYIDPLGNLMSLAKDERSEVIFWNTIGKPFSPIDRPTEIQDSRKALNLVGMIRGSRCLELLSEELNKFYLTIVPSVEPPKPKKPIFGFVSKFLKKFRIYDSTDFYDDW